ncbi:MAG: transketolase [Candidatus Cryosericum sp.]|nr:transketolase [bacterium]
MEHDYSIAELKHLATEIRKDTLRSITAAGSGHPGGSLSAADIMTALYFQVANLKTPTDPDRDRIFWSKGHIAPLLYTLLAYKGFFPREELITLRKFGSRLQGHPKKDSPPGVETSTGSLGQGLSVAVGCAYAARYDHSPVRVWCLNGDGELQEGQIWEALMAGAHFKLDNLCTIIDNNGLQIDGKVADVMDLGDLAAKVRAFGWHVIEIDGHDMQQCVNALEEAKTVKGQPTAIIAHTIKGKGVSFMEDQAGWHGKAPSQDELAQALRELDGEEGE